MQQHKKRFNTSFLFRIKGVSILKSKIIVGINSDLHKNMNNINSKEELELLVKMLRDYLESKGVTHYIMNGDISYDKEDIDYFKELMVTSLGNIEFRSTLGNHDIAKPVGISIADYVALTNDKYALKNNPIVSDKKAILSVDYIYDYGFYHKDLKGLMKETPLPMDSLLKLTNERIFSDQDIRFEHLEGIIEEQTKHLTKMVEKYKDKELIFVSHYMPKEEFVADNVQQDKRLAFKNAFMGSNKIGEALEELGFSACYFGHTHRRVGGLINGIHYYCNPIGTEHDWKKWCELVNYEGYKLYRRYMRLEYDELLKKYKPSESLLRLYTRMIETLQIVNL